MRSDRSTPDPPGAVAIVGRKAKHHYTQQLPKGTTPLEDAGAGCYEVGETACGLKIGRLSLGPAGRVSVDQQGDAEVPGPHLHTISVGHTGQIVGDRPRRANLLGSVLKTGRQ